MNRTYQHDVQVGHGIAPMEQVLATIKVVLPSTQVPQMVFDGFQHDQYHVLKYYHVARDGYRRTPPGLFVTGPDEAVALAGPSGGQMRTLVAVVAAALTAAGATFAFAQHQHHHDASAPVAPDSRQLVKFPAPMVEHTLANMRDHLQTLGEIQSHLAMGHTDVAAKIAEERLGMSSLGLHGAAEASKYMPKGMQDAGTAMHRAASRFAITAVEAGVTGDMKPVLAGLAEITAQCVGCHAGYRLK